MTTKASNPFTKMQEQMKKESRRERLKDDKALILQSVCLLAQKNQVKNWEDLIDTVMMVADLVEEKLEKEYFE